MEKDLKDRAKDMATLGKAHPLLKQLGEEGVLKFAGRVKIEINILDGVLDPNSSKLSFTSVDGDQETWSSLNKLRVTKGD